MSTSVRQFSTLGLAALVGLLAAAAARGQEVVPADPAPAVSGFADGLPDPAAPDAPAANADDLDSLLDAADKDIGQLSQVSVAATSQVAEYTPAALTQVPKNIVPAAVTHITKEDIQRSGARSLDELLDIYVPNLQVIRHHWEQEHLGLRGIMGNREDKYLLLVNRRIMNDKTHYGAASERLMVQLKDIHHIDVIRGPGSSVLGPGAVSMVISIFTDTAETFQGTQATARGGMFDEFSSIEFKHGRQWQDAEGGLFVYGGTGTRDGADTGDSPLVFGGSNPGWPGFDNLTTQYEGYQAGQNVTNAIGNDGHAFQGQMPFKGFIDLIYEDFEVWARYTRSGSYFQMSPAAGFHFPNGFGTFVDQFQGESGNQQTTVQSKYETDLTESTRFLAMCGWDSSEFVRNQFSGTADAYREDELNARTLLITDLGNHQFAAGAEFYYDWFGLRQDLINAPPTNSRLGANFTPWETQTYSLLGEDQWKITDDFTTFIGGRLDNNTYTPWMFSPRAAFVYTPEEDRAWKVLLNRSLRMNFAEENRAQWLTNGSKGEPEILRSYELRHERNPSDSFFWAISGFYIDLDAISWNQATSVSDLIGNQTQWGMEGELAYKTDQWRVVGSHSFAKLIDFQLFDPTAQTFITAAPNGFGNDLANWSNHISKLFVHRQLNTFWSVDSSLRYYWGFPGQRDLIDRTNAGNSDVDAKTEPNWKRSYRESVFLNSGLAFRYNEHFRCRLDGYNLLGIFEEDLNKRNFYADHSFISETPAIGLSCEVTH